MRSLSLSFPSRTRITSLRSSPTNVRQRTQRRTATTAAGAAEEGYVSRMCEKRSRSGPWIARRAARHHIGRGRIRECRGSLRAGRGCGKMAAAAAAAASCVVKCADVPRDVENATADRVVVLRAATPRRQPELYRFRATDLLYYASSVSFFFADVATGEQRVLHTRARTHTHTRDTACVRATRGVPRFSTPISVDRSVRDRSNVLKLLSNGTEQTSIRL